MNERPATVLHLLTEHCRIPVSAVLTFIAVVGCAALAADPPTTGEDVGEAVERLNRLLDRPVIEIASEASLVVTVLAYDAGPLPGATVEVWQPGTEDPKPARGFTDIHGRVRFDGIRPALYRVHVSFPGYESSRQWVLVLETDPDGRTVKRTITLEEPEFRGGFEPAAARSGGARDVR